MRTVSSPTATTESTRPTSTAWGRTATTGSATRRGSSSTPPGTRGWTRCAGTSSRGSGGYPAAGTTASWTWSTIQVGCCQVCDKHSYNCHIFFYILQFVVCRRSLFCILSSVVCNPNTKLTSHLECVKSSFLQEKGFVIRQILDLNKKRIILIKLITAVHMWTSEEIVPD